MPKDWPTNITERDKEGFFRSVNGASDEFIAIGRTIKAGFVCSKVDIKSIQYDAIVGDLSPGEKPKFLRMQITGTSTNRLDLTRGGRSGKQIIKGENRVSKYTKRDCDIILGINSKNGVCYIIPVEDIQEWGKTVRLSKLEKYKENWEYFKKATS